MHIHYITGGARSGKSAFAVQCALAMSQHNVTFIATAVSSDEDMARRIEQHRHSRPAAWTTIESPTRTGIHIRNARSPVVLLDCLTLLVSNTLLANADAGEPAFNAAIATEMDELLAAAASRDGTFIVVSNEVGMGVVPHTEYGRWFRDAAGRANQRIAAQAQRATLLVSGLPLQLKG
jgi:adenosyl cobinamide kinase/adenosyl cobinamide phosphate guanylyltransferase